MSRAEEGTEPRKKSQEKPGHGPSLRDSVDRKSDSCKLLILRSNGILATDKGLLGVSGALAGRRDEPLQQKRGKTLSLRLALKVVKIQNDRGVIGVIHHPCSGDANRNYQRISDFVFG